MALVMYILLVVLQSGLQGQFHPEVLSKSGSRALAILLLDFVFVKTGCYFLNVQGSSQIVDLIAYGGHKFVGCIGITSCESGTVPRQFACHASQGIPDW
jgi:hypothetical protein